METKQPWYGSIMLVETFRTLWACCCFAVSQQWSEFEWSGRRDRTRGTYYMNSRWVYESEESYDSQWMSRSGADTSEWEERRGEERSGSPPTLPIIASIIGSVSRFSRSLAKKLILPVCICVWRIYI